MGILFFGTLAAIKKNERSDKAQKEQKKTIKEGR